MRNGFLSFLVCGFLVVGLLPVAAAAPPPTLVTCGFEVTTSIVIGNSLFECPLHGLVVKAPNVAIDLNGYTIGGNSMDDAPSVVEAGIDNSEGHAGVVVRNGTVKNFEAGLSILAASGNRVERIRADKNGVGFFFHGGTGHTLKGNTASSNEDGFIIVGGGHTLKGNTASSNGDTGFISGGTGHTLKGNSASGNGTGFVLAGSDHVLKANTASGNGTGFNFGGSGYALHANTAAGNQVDGFSFAGTAHTFRSNKASGNQHNGFLFSGTDHMLKSNSVSDNGFDGIFVTGGSGHEIVGNKTHRNGFANGLVDGLGLGIHVDPAVATLTAEKNKAEGNDDPAECSANGGCN